MPILLELFLTFFKIGLFTFGGGYAMIPIIEDEVIAKGWFLEEELMNFIAISESTPGPIAINMATFIGAGKAGFLGALLSTLGVVLPAFIVILLVASVIKNLLKFKGVNAFLEGVRPVVIGLITVTGLMMLLNVLLGISTIDSEFSFDYKALIIFAILTVVYFVYKKITKKNVSAILLIVISAVLGIILYGLIP